MADYDLKDLDRSRPGQTLEKNDGGLLPGGVWKHPNGAEIIVQIDPLFGDGQARAAERVGFVYERPAKPGEIKTIVDASQAEVDRPKAETMTSGDLKGLMARLDALEAENSTLKNQKQSGQEVPGTEAVVSAKEAKEAATEKTAEQTGVKVDTATGETSEVATATEAEKTPKK